MEDPKRPPVQGSNDALFSERVALWLDEGDRLDVEVAAAPPAPGEHQPSDQGRVRRLFARHRLGVVAGMGLLPLALFLSLHRGSAPPSVPAAAIVAAPASITPPSQPIAPAPAAVAPSAAAVASPAAPVAIAESPVEEAEAADESPARQGRHHRHHHHRRTAHHRSSFHR
ncbi:MAG TPA: hypothetical protein VKZ18_08585 [Polyangia bacterium]|nr:hypothetical protein [Polyangia bacterium]